MLGRVLFVFVCLIIAAGLVLPLYPHPRDAVRSVVAASDPVQLVAASDAFGCPDCPVADRSAECEADCRCDEVLPAAFVRLDQGARVTLAVSVPPQAEPARLPAKLPAI